MRLILTCLLFSIFAVEAQEYKPTAELNHPNKISFSSPEVSLPKCFILKKNKTKLIEIKSFPLEADFPISFSKLSIPSLFIQGKSIHRVFDMSAKLKLTTEEYPDFSVGSSRWTNDVLGSFAYLEDKNFTDRLFHKTTGTSLDSLLASFLASSRGELLKKIPPNRQLRVTPSQGKQPFAGIKKTRRSLLYSHSFFQSITSFKQSTIISRTLKDKISSHTYASQKIENHLHLSEMQLAISHPSYNTAPSIVKSFDAIKFQLANNLSKNTFHPLFASPDPEWNIILLAPRCFMEISDNASFPIFANLSYENSDYKISRYPVPLDLKWPHVTFSSIRLKTLDPSNKIYIERSLIPKKTNILAEVRCKIPTIWLDIKERNFASYSYEGPKASKIPDIDFKGTPLAPTPNLSIIVAPINPFKDGGVVFVELPLHLLGSHSGSFSFYRTDDALRTNRTHRFINYHLIQLPSLTTLSTDSLGNEFQFDVKTYPSSKGDSYYFALHVRPSQTITLTPMNEHIYFLVDKNSSIEKHRFDVFTDSIVNAIKYLPDKTTTFNVFLFDDKIEAISSEELKPGGSSVDFVKKAFTKRIKRRTSTFANLHTILETLKERARGSNDIYTVVVLSNGQLMKNIRYHRDTLFRLVHNKPQNFTIHTATISDKNNFPMLEFLSNIGGGEFVYSQTHNSFPRKFAVFLKKIASPIAKDIDIYSLSQNGHFVHNKEIAPPLYTDRSYTFYGKTTSLEPLDVIIQAHTGTHFINIRKRLSLKDAAKGKPTYEKEYSSQKAKAAMLRFLLTNDQSALLEAKELLAAYDSPLPFK